MYKVQTHVIQDSSVIANTLLICEFSFEQGVRNLRLGRADLCPGRTQRLLQSSHSPIIIPPNLPIPSAELFLRNDVIKLTTLCSFPYVPNVMTLGFNYFNQFALLKAKFQHPSFSDSRFLILYPRLHRRLYLEFRI